jgi:hypothetical protein
MEIDGFKKKYSGLADRFRIYRRRLVKRIFVDETILLRIEGQDYQGLRWLAYESGQDA